jgi:hypothetical protein
MTTVITLVHGTWGWFTPFLRSDSVLQNSLKKSLGQNTVFVPFRWSGLNSPRLRSRASKKLGEQLYETFAHYPESRQFIVAHSHGGNVVLKAFDNDPKLSSRIAGVACLSTPFIVANQREHFSATRSSSWALLAVAVAVITIQSVSDRYLEYVLRLPEWMASTLILMCPLIAIFILWWIGKLWRLFGLRTLEHLRYDTDPNLDLLIIRTSSDEAGTALGSFQIINLLVDRIGYFLNGVHDFVGSILFREDESWWDRFPSLKIILLISGIGFIALATPSAILAYLFRGAAAITPSFVQALLWILLILLLPIAVIVGGSIFLWMAAFSFQPFFTLLTFPIYLILIPILAPFGVELALSSFWVNVSAEASPVGTWVVNLLRSEVHGFALAHTGIHERLQVASLIGDWANNHGHAPGVPAPVA